MTVSVSVETLPYACISYFCVLTSCGTFLGTNLWPVGVQPSADNSVYDVKPEGVTLGSDLANTVLGCAILVFDEP